MTYKRAIPRKYPYFTNSTDAHTLAREWETHVERVGTVDKAREWLLFYAKEVKK